MISIKCVISGNESWVLSMIPKPSARAWNDRLQPLQIKKNREEQVIDQKQAVCFVDSQGIGPRELYLRAKQSINIFTKRILRVFGKGSIVRDLT